LILLIFAHLIGRYGHLNNSSYYLIADSIINGYLVNHCGIQPFIHPSFTPVSGPSSLSPPAEKDAQDVVGLVISNSCRYFASCSFPAPLEVRLRVVKLGKSSVTYQVSIAEEQSGSAGEGRTGDVAALITSTHVFVDRHTRRPESMPPQVRAALEKVSVQLEPGSKL